MGRTSKATANLKTKTKNTANVLFVALVFTELLVTGTNSTCCPLLAKKLSINSLANRNRKNSTTQSTKTCWKRRKSWQSPFWAIWPFNVKKNVLLVIMISSATKKMDCYLTKGLSVEFADVGKIVRCPYGDFQHTTTDENEDDTTEFENGGKQD